MIKIQFNLNIEGGNAKKVPFSWTEEETVLLIKVVLDYKTAKLAGRQDWEYVRTKLVRRHVVKVL